MNKQKLLAVLNLFPKIRIETQLKLIRLIIWVLFIIFIYTVVLGAIQAFPQKFQNNNQGFENFLVYFSSTIKVGALTIIILTIYLTLQRMHQTEWQIHLISDNNRFNNFYKHREEFLKFFQDKKFFIHLASGSGYTPKQLLLNHHRFYFSENANEFNNEIKEESLNNIKKFVSSVKKRGLNSINLKLNDLNIQDVIEPNLFITVHYFEIRTLISVHTNSISFKTNSKIPEDHYHTFLKLWAIYYNYLIILEIVTFDGQKLEDFALSEFASGFASLCNSYSIHEILHA